MNDNTTTKQTAPKHLLDLPVELREEDGTKVSGAFFVPVPDQTDVECGLREILFEMRGPDGAAEGTVAVGIISHDGAPRASLDALLAEFARFPDTFGNPDFNLGEHDCDTGECRLCRDLWDGVPPVRVQIFGLGQRDLTVFISDMGTFVELLEVITTHPARRAAMLTQSRKEAQRARERRARFEAFKAAVTRNSAAMHRA
jgi:hypothetical protein